MTGEQGNDKRCPVCGGRLRAGVTVVPFLLAGSVALVKDVPAEICASCREPYLTGQVTDRIIGLLNPLRDLKAEVLILAYPEPQPVLSPAMALSA